MLYIVSTPIGNLEDITFRAVRTLKEVDCIAAEDTRHVRKLLDKYEIKTKVISYHSYSGSTKVDKLVDMMKEGQSVALVSDAGTPGISDPAYSLIKKSIEEDIKISPIPGASSLLAALVMSGKPMNQFLYLGFIPVKKGRQTLLKSLVDEKRTIVIFESPHRILKTLNDFLQYFGDKEIAIAREITKIYEETLRMNISDAIKHFEEKKAKGEFVLIV